MNAKIQPMAQATGSILVSSLLASCLIPFIWQYAPTHLPQAKSLFALIYSAYGLACGYVLLFQTCTKYKGNHFIAYHSYYPMLAMVIGAVLNHEHLSMMVFGSIYYLVWSFLYFYKDIQANRNFAQHIKSK